MGLRRDDRWSLDQADALNSYLDAMISRGAFPSNGLDPTLQETVARIHSLTGCRGQTSAIKQRVWKESLAARQARAGDTISRVGTPEVWNRFRHRWRLGGPLAAALLVMIVLGVGYITYRAAPSQNGSPTIPAALIPLGTPASSPEAALPGCTVQPRSKGSVAALAGERPTRFRQLPRYNDDPIHFDQRSAQVTSSSLLGDRSAAPAPTVDGIKATLAELTACRFYANGPDGHVDLDGRYFALYSDDYFRGELAGYREAGLDPTLTVFWMPLTIPTIADARLLDDGRVIVVFETENDRNHPDWRWVAVFAHAGNRWLVDEVGEAKFPAVVTPSTRGTTPATPIALDIALYDQVSVQPTVVATPPFTPTHQSTGDAWVNLRADPTTDSSIVTVLPPASPLRWLAQEKSDHNGTKWMRFETATDEIGWIRAVDVELPTGHRPQLSVCDPLSATPVPCGESYQRFGPYTYNEFSAETDVTIRLHNAGDRAHRFVIRRLDIDVNVKAGGEATFVMNAPAGKYLFLIYEDGAEPIGAGVFEFIPADQQPSNG